MSLPIDHAIDRDWLLNIKSLSVTPSPVNLKKELHLDHSFINASNIRSFDTTKKYNEPSIVIWNNGGSKVAFVGKTGSGKSTTLAGMIDHINSNLKKHIITLEDPVEYVFDDNSCVIEQREVGLDTPSYEKGLKHVMRQDPDIIRIGEMRDATSFRAAMSASDTGHLVMSTLHTIDAPQSISRVLDFFASEEREQVRKQMVGTLKAIIVQRMAVREDGGVVPAIEIMINTPTITKLISENRTEKLHAAIETGTDDGMQNFNQSLFQLVKDGVISKEEALDKASNPQALEMNSKGIFLSEGNRILN